MPDDGQNRQDPIFVDPGQNLRHLQMLLDLSQQVAAMDTLDAVLERLVAVAVEETGAERGSLFLGDPDSGELYSRIAQGVHRREIRILDTEGIAGAVYQSGMGEIITDAYGDPRFNPEVDAETGFKTRNLMCAPVRNARGHVIGVTQILNKSVGEFDDNDVAVVESLTTQCAITLESMQMIEQLKVSQAREMDFLNIVADMTSELDLAKLLQKVMSEASRMLDAERSTLFLNDERTGELFSHVGEGLETQEIRLPNHAGIAGAVFTCGETINIPHAYADLRFNPSFDRQTGFFTRSILCVPVINKQGRVIGVTQTLNKRGGPFSEEDESRLKAFTAQIAIGLENAKLFEDVQSMKNYADAMLQSMSNGVITFNAEGIAQTCNAAGGRILRCDEDGIVGRPVTEVLGQRLAERVTRVEESRQDESALDVDLSVSGAEVSANVSVLPLGSGDGKSLGTLVMLEDISSEKRVKSTMSRYMDPDLADRLLAEGTESELLGGKDQIATVVFTDMRGFSTITEQLGAQGTVQLLNQYFERMVGCISDHGGLLDKFIGDAIMAGFGIPVPRGDDEDNALRASIAMIQQLWQWNEERAASGLLTLDMGVGISTDQVVSGNIGSAKRMDYTMIGDGVNLAARLESACKQYSARILLSGHTQERLRGVYRLREIDRVVVKGKTVPVPVWECLDYHTDESFPNMSEALGSFNDGMKAYRAAQWDKAQSAFMAALDANPNDKLSDLYVWRCQHLELNPPGDDWDGVWVMTEK